MQLVVLSSESKAHFETAYTSLLGEYDNLKKCLKKATKVFARCVGCGHYGVCFCANCKQTQCSKCYSRIGGDTCQHAYCNLCQPMFEKCPTNPHARLTCALNIWMCCYAFCHICSSHACKRITCSHCSKTTNHIMAKCEACAEYVCDKCNTKTSVCPACSKWHCSKIDRPTCRQCCRLSDPCCSQPIGNCTMCVGCFNRAAEKIGKERQRKSAPSKRKRTGTPARKKSKL